MKWRFTKAKPSKLVNSSMDYLSGIIVRRRQKYGCMLSNDFLRSEMVALLQEEQPMSSTFEDIRLHLCFKNGRVRHSSQEESGSQ